MTQTKKNIIWYPKPKVAKTQEVSGMGTSQDFLSKDQKAVGRGGGFGFNPVL